MPTSKETIEALAREGPRQGKDVGGLPKSAGEPRAPSLVVGSRDEQHGDWWRGEKG